MFSRVANELGGSIKPHRLTIDQRSGKDSRVVAFYPRGHINQQRKTGGMRFRKAILSETADLLEDTFGEFTVVSSFDHSLHQLFMKFRNNTRLPPRPHRAAKLIGFLLSPEAQKTYAEANFEFPVLPGVALHPSIAHLGALTLDSTRLSDIAAQRGAASMMVDRVGFDQ